MRFLLILLGTLVTTSVLGGQVCAPPIPSPLLDEQGAIALDPDGGPAQVIGALDLRIGDSEASFNDLSEAAQLPSYTDQ